MISTSAHQNQSHPVRFSRIRLDWILWIFAAFTLAGCDAAAETTAPVLSPTSDSPPAATAPSGAASPAPQAATLTLPPPAVTTTPPSGATLTPWPTNTLEFLPSATPAAGTPWPACPRSRESRLRVGVLASVSKDPPQANNVRDAAGVSRLKVGQIQPGERVKVIEGPECVANWTWWKIQSLESGLTGWTAEGDEDNYWLVPEN